MNGRADHAGSGAGWNHNLHYLPFVMGALPERIDAALDVGTGEGQLAGRLAERAHTVTAIDADPPTLELARTLVGRPNLELVCGDVRTYPFALDSFDVVTCVATLHHLDAREGIGRLAELLAPGGTLVVVGLARSSSPTDLAVDAVGSIASKVLRRGRSEHESVAPTRWPPEESYRSMRRLARSLLPGVRYRRHLLFRYSLVWHKPTG